MDFIWYVRIGGVLQLSLLVASALVPGTLDWRGQLRRLDPLLRQMVWIYGGYIVLMIAGLGLLSLVFAAELTSGTPLTRALAGFIGLFWLIRLTLQLFVLEAKQHLTKPHLKIGYHALTCIFAYLTTIFILTAITGK